MIFGYEIILHTPTYHNEHFIGNIPSYVTVHAESEAQARERIELDGQQVCPVSNELTIHKHEQSIYSIRCLGRVVTRVVIEYEQVW